VELRCWLGTWMIVGRGLVVGVMQVQMRTQTQTQTQIEIEMKVGFRRWVLGIELLLAPMLGPVPLWLLARRQNQRLPTSGRRT